MSLSHLLSQRQVVIIDGALATELERHGADLNHSLWSANLLLHEPARIATVHADYLAAGAQVLITASYQATLPGFVAAGYHADDARTAIQRSVTLARDARTEWIAAHPDATYHPIIAGSIGPYGAYTADGGEYRGQYGLSSAALQAFHLPRMELLAAAGVDCFACETIPDLDEVVALAACLARFPTMESWISLSCRDDAHTWAGQPVRTVAAFLETQPHVTAIGINCTAPEHVPGLIRAIVAVTTKPIVVYPNSGEHYDPITKTWSGTVTCADYLQAAQTWVGAGASIVGGCCRTTPEHIRTLATFFASERHADAP